MVLKAVITEVTKVVMKAHTDIMSTTITNMIITIMITDTNFMKNGENTVDTKVNIMDIMKVDTTVNTDIITDITEVMVIVTMFPERKKLLLLLAKKLLLKMLQRNGGWLEITGVVGDILTGDILTLIMMVVAGNGVTLDFTDMEDVVDTADMVVVMADMAVMEDMVVMDTVRVESLIVVNLLIQQLPRDVDVILEQLVTVDITLLTMVQDMITTITESKDLGHLDMITSVMIGRIGITTIITSNILPTFNIFHVMIIVAVMDVHVFHEVHVAFHVSILLFILRLLMLSETVSETDTGMDSLDTETDLDLDLEMVSDLEMDLETVSETDLVLETDMAMDSDSGMDSETVIMVLEVVSTIMACTATVDGQYVDSTTTEYVINVAIFQAEDQDACVKVFAIIHFTCQLSTDLLMCTSIATLAPTSSLTIDASPELTFQFHKKNPKKLVQPSKEYSTHMLTTVHGLPTHGGEIGGVVKVIMLGVNVMALVLLVDVLVELVMDAVDMVDAVDTVDVVDMAGVVDMAWDVQWDSALVVELICNPITAKIKLRKLLEKMKKPQQKGFAFQSDIMVDMGFPISTDIQALVRVSGDGDGHGSKTRFQDQN